MSDRCPKCGSDLRGELIPEQHIAGGLYASGATHYSRKIGVEIPGVYDGVLFWQCPDCGGKWHRFGHGTRLHTKAISYVGSE